MDQQPAPTRPDSTAATRLKDRLSSPTGIAVVALALGLGTGYVFSQGRAQLHEANVACMSAPGVISCGPVDSPGHADYAVPLDVAWTKDGSFHSGGRPDCLAPTAAARSRCG